MSEETPLWKGSPSQWLNLGPFFGAILVAGPDYPIPIRILGTIAVFASMTNIVSGFLITERMLKMFKSEPKPGEGKRP